MSAILKMTGRAIRTNLARFMAILFIVALSAGFFSGLKISTDAMLNTGDKYLDEQNFYDFRLFSTIGFTEENVEEFKKLDGIDVAEGTYSIDALLNYNENIRPYKIHAIPQSTNLLTLVSGRFPTAPNECLADAQRFTEDDIGKTFKVSLENKESVTSQLNTTEFTIVGLVNSPLYIGIDRGTTTIGGGAVSTFLYIPAECFEYEVYTEINLSLSEKEKIYSDEYDKLIEAHKSEVTSLCENQAKKRYDDILSENHITPEIAAALGIEEPSTYVLTRDENSGYVSFQNDTSIIGSVANIFPIFFIAISILVCITTMTRMVDEERTQIGVLKAMGYGNGAVLAKYLLYAGIATLIGWALGFFVCTWALPKVFWLAYNELYDFAPISYLFSGKLAIITLAISMISILGSTYISCRKELSSVPATLIRPKAGKAGKRVFLEKIKPLWSRLSFLQKITVRNMFRYKQRLFMMLVGISCCAGLVVTAFGVRDSMITVGENQYRNIQTYDIEISFDEDNGEMVTEKLNTSDKIDKYLNVRKDTADIYTDISMPSVNLISYKNGTPISDFWNFQSGDKTLPLPGANEALISPKVAEKLSLSVGDTFTIRNANMETGEVTVAGIFDNHIYDYVVISDETYSGLFGEWTPNTSFITADSDAEQTAKSLTDIPEIESVLQLQTYENNITEALGCLNYIIWMVVLFSGTLAFVVIFNLTNINIAERRREIATVQVLGFYPRETENYVLKENLILSVIASIIGLPLGKLFHLAVMGMVKIDMINFDNVINPLSYLLAFVCTVLFAIIVNRFMKHQIEKVNMAESLKAVE